jgi:Ca2+/Na+ antiporter
MKTLLKVLLLALFAVVIFMPMGKIAQWAYWSLFFIMFAVLYVYYRLSYWVGDADIHAIDKRRIKFSIFSGKVPPLTSEDLVRGRLVVFDDEVALFQRTHEAGLKAKAKKVWSVPIDEVTGFSIGKVIGFRGGLTLSLADGDEALFAIFFMNRRKADLVHALGWDEETS